MIAQTIAGAVVLFPAFYWCHGITLREFAACIVLAVLIACCMPDSWKGE